MWIRASAAAAAVCCAGLVLGGAPASAGEPVDPSTLVPEPPPGATCRADGVGVICETVFLASLQNEPAFPLPCGLVYETADEVRRGIRWYVDGLLTRRFVFADDSGSWSLSPTGAGPAASWVGKGNWQNVDVDAEATEETLD